MAGVVLDAQGAVVPGATVTAVHEPSGTSYEAVTQGDGRFTIPAMRVGGPYKVTAELTGFGTQAKEGVEVTLGTSADLSFTLSVATLAEAVTVVATPDSTFGSQRTGAATAVSRKELAVLPTVSGRINDITRLTPQYSGNGSFAGADNRMNNITVDGSYFNNSFGLAGQPGDRTNVAPISLEAIEQIQVSIAPYDVRQGNFVGAGVNTVTRSGTNQIRGSFYYRTRNESYVGEEAGGLPFNPGTFETTVTGFTAGGPFIRNKLFGFTSFEKQEDTRPLSTFVANPGGVPAAGNTTRVLASDLNQLSSFLSSSLNYETGPYENIPKATPAKPFLVKGDYNLNPSNKVTFRYSQLSSSTDVNLSNSSSLGFGRQGGTTNFLQFGGSNYSILENIKSGIGEWNATFGNSMANSLIAGYTAQDESRGAIGELFPFVDILDGSGIAYTSFGSEPFTPNNELRYNTFQLQDSFTKFGRKHTLTFGGAIEKYHSENVFFPGKQSAYVYNTLADFYADAQGFLANPNRTTSPVNLRRFQVRYMNIPGLEKPVQPLDVWYSSAYVQDEFRPRNDLTITAGVRMDLPVWGDTAYANANVDALTFRDPSGAPVSFETGALPKSTPLWSPRVGFNWNVGGTGNTQVRGGTGVFTGKPAYVWISNQIGNTGVLTGFEELNNTTARPFNPDPDRYKPATVTGAPASSFELSLTDPDFKFPQVWRTNFAVDQRLPWNMTGTAEFIFNKDVNGIYYINANLAPANTAFAGPDNRPRWTASNRINATVANAVVLKNQSVGQAMNISASLEKHFKAGFLKAAYSYGVAKNTVDPGSIAFGSWNGNQHSGDPNNPGKGFSAGSPGHRAFLAGSYSAQWLKFGATTLGFFTEGITDGNLSYTYSGDLNGDGGTSNDLIYIPRDTSEMNFQTFAQGGRTFTAAAQAAAWEAYIQQDKYLRAHRGEYATRNALLLPMSWRTDISIAQDLFKNIGGRRHELKFRADILNFFNLLNSDWGVGQRFVSGNAPNAQPLIVPTAAQGGPADAQGRAQYRLRVVNNQLLTKSLEQTTLLRDVYRVQFQFQYTFN